MSKEKYMYQDMEDPTKPCLYEVSEIMLGFHITKFHLCMTKKEEIESNPKKIKRMDAKPPKFLKSETRDKFRRKQPEFDTYKARAKIDREEEADDLYLACDTPLRRKLVASNKVNRVMRRTKPEILMNELERICLPKLSLVVE